MRRLALEFAQNRWDGNSAFHKPEDPQRAMIEWHIAGGLEHPAAAEALRQANRNPSPSAPLYGKIPYPPSFSRELPQ